MGFQKHQASMAALKKDDIDFEKLEKELSAALEYDARYWRENDAKFRAIHQKVETYEEFRDIVLAAHLKPLEKKDQMPDHFVQPWNATAVRQQPGDQCRSTSEGPSPMEFKVPETSLGFATTWKRLKTRAAKFSYIIFIGADQLRRIFSTEISGGLLGPILQALAMFSPNQADDIISILEAMTEAKRFKLDFQFLDSCEKEVCQDVFTKLESVLNERCQINQADNAESGNQCEEKAADPGQSVQTVGQCEEKAADPGQSVQTVGQCEEKADPGQSVQTVGQCEEKAADPGQSVQTVSQCEEKADPGQSVQTVGQCEEEAADPGQSVQTVGQCEEKAADPGQSVQTVGQCEEKPADPGQSVQTVGQCEEKAADPGQSVQTVGQCEEKAADPGQSVQTVGQCEEKVADPGQSVQTVGQCEEKAADPGQSVQTVSQCEEKADPGQSVQTVGQCEEKAADPGQSVQTVGQCEEKVADQVQSVQTLPLERLRNLKQHYGISP